MYRKLRGKIVEVFGNQQSFADAMGMSLSALSQRLNGGVAWSVPEMVKACNALGIEYSNAWEYFFT